MLRFIQAGVILAIALLLLQLFVRAGLELVILFNERMKRKWRSSKKKTK